MNSALYLVEISSRRDQSFMGYAVLSNAKRGGVHITEDRARAYRCTLPTAVEIARRLHDGLSGVVVRAQHDEAAT